MPPAGGSYTYTRPAAAGAAGGLLLAGLTFWLSLMHIDLSALPGTLVHSGFPVIAFYWITAIALLLYIVAKVKQWMETYHGAGMHLTASEHAADLEALRQSLARIEKKVDTIEGILEKVAE